MTNEPATAGRPGGRLTRPDFEGLLLQERRSLQRYVLVTIALLVAAAFIAFVDLAFLHLRIHDEIYKLDKLFAALIGSSGALPAKELLARLERRDGIALLRSRWDALAARERRDDTELARMAELVWRLYERALMTGGRT